MVESTTKKKLVRTDGVLLVPRQTTIVTMVIDDLELHLQTAILETVGFQVVDPPNVTVSKSISFLLTV